MALWGAVLPLPEPESQPGQSRGRGREGVRGSFPLGLFVCFLMVKVAFEFSAPFAQIMERVSVLLLNAEIVQIQAPGLH